MNRRDGVKSASFLFQPVKFNRPGDGIGGATAELALVINRRALGTQIRAGGQNRRPFDRRGIKMVAVVRQIRQPAVAGNLITHGPFR